MLKMTYESYKEYFHFWLVILNQPEIALRLDAACNLFRAAVGQAVV